MPPARVSPYGALEVAGHDAPVQLPRRPSTIQEIPEKVPTPKTRQVRCPEGLRLGRLSLIRDKKDSCYSVCSNSGAWHGMPPVPGSRLPDGWSDR
jgi:hypothetical protein